MNVNSDEPVQKILIVGSGWTGRQIAAQVVAHGLTAYLSDLNTEIVEEGIQWASVHLKQRKEEGTWPNIDLEACQSRLHPLEKLSESPHSFDLVLECVLEQAAVKRRVLKQISNQFGPHSIIASNSSYFVPSILSKYVAFPERFAHLHFHVPIWLSTVVDVVPGPETEPWVLDKLNEFSLRIGQTPILEKNENPGYIFNWMLQSWLKSALQLVDRKVATPEEIDFVWTKITKMDAGPFATMDHIGIDVIHQVLSNARWMESGNEIQALIDILQPKVDSGELGVKSGRGFYSYKNGVSTAKEPPLD